MYKMKKGRLHELALKKGFHSLIDLADGAGLSETAVYNVNGGGDFRYGTAQKLADCLCISITSLIKTSRRESEF